MATPAVPNELWLQIFSNVRNYKTLRSICCTCKQFNVLVSVPNKGNIYLILFRELPPPTDDENRTKAIFIHPYLENYFSVAKWSTQTVRSRSDLLTIGISSIRIDDVVSLERFAKHLIAYFSLSSSPAFQENATSPPLRTILFEHHISKFSKHNERLSDKYFLRGKSAVKVCDVLNHATSTLVLIWRRISDDPENWEWIRGKSGDKYKRVYIDGMMKALEVLAEGQNTSKNCRLLPYRDFEYKVATGQKIYEPEF